MKLIYAQGFSKTEKLEWKPVVLINVIQSLRLIFDAMEDYAIDFERKENEVCLVQTASSWRYTTHSLVAPRSCHREGGIIVAGS